eukprot:TRINITY_DN25036_c0_g1_i1.p1 TRINITY_DN25036_c0_g1~~TRINITY_DN25036_c0_g1_i1.p1  ORF type:complete len:748 (+),score=99.57 TRINITY_DN25036_c0_g1_i1:82-2325(+)
MPLGSRSQRHVWQKFEDTTNEFGRVARSKVVTERRKVDGLSAWHSDNSTDDEVDKLRCDLPLREQLCEIQRDLAEVERKICKHRGLLKQSPVRTRNRVQWIAKEHRYGGCVRTRFAHMLLTLDSEIAHPYARGRFSPTFGFAEAAIVSTAVNAGLAPPSLAMSQQNASPNSARSRGQDSVGEGYKGTPRSIGPTAAARGAGRRGGTPKKIPPQAVSASLVHQPLAQQPFCLNGPASQTHPESTSAVADAVVVEAAGESWRQSVDAIGLSTATFSARASAPPTWSGSMASRTSVSARAAAAAQTRAAGSMQLRRSTAEDMRMRAAIEASRRTAEEEARLRVIVDEKRQLRMSKEAVRAEGESSDGGAVLGHDVTVVPSTNATSLEAWRPTDGGSAGDAPIQGRGGRSVDSRSTMGSDSPRAPHLPTQAILQQDECGAAGHTASSVSDSPNTPDAPSGRNLVFEAKRSTESRSRSSSSESDVPSPPLAVARQNVVSQGGRGDDSSQSSGSNSPLVRQTPPPFPAGLASHCPTKSCSSSSGSDSPPTLRISSIEPRPHQSECSVDDCEKGSGSDGAYEKESEVATESCKGVEEDCAIEGEIEQMEEAMGLENRPSEAGLHRGRVYATDVVADSNDSGGDVGCDLSWASNNQPSADVNTDHISDTSRPSSANSSSSENNSRDSSGAAPRNLMESFSRFEARMAAERSIENGGESGHFLGHDPQGMMASDEVVVTRNETLSSSDDSGSDSDD